MTLVVIHFAIFEALRNGSSSKCLWLGRKSKEFLNGGRIAEVHQNFLVEPQQHSVRQSHLEMDPVPLS